MYNLIEEIAIDNNSNEQQVLEYAKMLNDVLPYSISDELFYECLNDITYLSKKNKGDMLSIVERVVSSVL